MVLKDKRVVCTECWDGCDYVMRKSQPFDKIMFETISAFATVGLSTGITASLSEPGKLILVLVMICGRLGPLTLAIMLARPVETRIRYPEESVYTG